MKVKNIYGAHYKTYKYIHLNFARKLPEKQYISLKIAG